MDFFNNLGKQIGKTAKTVTKKSEELVEITKLNMSIGNEEDKIKKLFIEIGSELYGKFAEGVSFDDCFNDKCMQIKAIEETIEILKDKVKSLKGQKNSPDCCHDVQDDENHCSSCENKAEDKK